MKRSLTLCLTLCLAIACGDTTDPSANNTTNNNPTPTDMGNNTPEMPVTPTDMGDMNVTPPDMGDMGMDMTVEPMTCGIDDAFITRRSEAGKAGVTVLSSNAMIADAGLDKVWAEINRLQTSGGFPADDPNTMENTECSGDVTLTTPITITGAVVSGVGFTAGTFIQDKTSGMIFRPPTTVYPMMDGKPVFPKVGDKLNFTVTAVKRFGCHTPQISQITDYEVVSANNPIYAEVVDAQDITLATHSYKMIQVGGQLTNARECGRRMSNGDTFIGRCFDLNYGSGATKKVVTVRTESFNACLSSVGKCGTYLGPVTAFPGIFGENAMVQLNAVNFDWFTPGFTEEQCPNFDK